MFNKIKALKDLRSQAKDMQKKLDAIEVTGSSKDVIIKVNGNQQILSVEIPDQLLSDKTKLEGAIKDAMNEANKALQKQLASRMKDMGDFSEMMKQLGM